MNSEIKSQCADYIKNKALFLQKKSKDMEILKDNIRKMDET
jgi:hypothetical protein